MTTTSFVKLLLPCYITASEPSRLYAASAYGWEQPRFQINFLVVEQSRLILPASWRVCLRSIKLLTVLVTLYHPSVEPGKRTCRELAASRQTALWPCGAPSRIPASQSFSMPEQISRGENSVALRSNQLQNCWTTSWRGSGGDGPTRKQIVAMFSSS